jgi:hypothetical protein
MLERLSCCGRLAWNFTQDSRIKKRQYQTVSDIGAFRYTGRSLYYFIDPIGRDGVIRTLDPLHPMQVVGIKNRCLGIIIRKVCIAKNTLYCKGVFLRDKPLKMAESRKCIGLQEFCLI